MGGRGSGRYKKGVKREPETRDRSRSPNRYSVSREEEGVTIVYQSPPPSVKKEPTNEYNGKFEDFLSFLEAKQNSVSSCRDSFEKGITQLLWILYEPKEKDLQKLLAMKILTWLIKDHKSRALESKTHPDSPSNIFVRQYMVKTNSILAAKVNIPQESEAVRVAVLNYLGETFERKSFWNDFLEPEGIKIVTTVVYQCFFDDNLTFYDHYIRTCNSHGSEILKLAEQILQHLVKDSMLLNIMMQWTLKTIEENRKLYLANKNRLHLARVGGAISLLAALGPQLIVGSLNLVEIDKLIFAIPKKFKLIGEEGGADFGLALPYLDLVACFGRRAETTVYQFHYKLFTILAELLDSDCNVMTCKKVCSTITLLLKSPNSSTFLRSIKNLMITLVDKLTKKSLAAAHPTDTITTEVDKLHATIAKLFFTVKKQPPKAS